MATRRWGTEQLVNTTTAGIQAEPAVAVLANGDYVIAWQSDANNGDILAQRYSPGGLKIGGEIVVTSDGLSDGDPSIVGTRDGGFVIAFTRTISGSDSDPYIRRYDANGNPLAAVATINGATDLAGETSIALIGSTFDTNFAVAYRDPTASDGGDISVQRLDINGGFIGGIITANTTTAGVQDTPDIARLRNQNFVVAWGSDNLQVRARIFDHFTGISVNGASDFLVANYNGTNNPDTVAVIGLRQAGFVVVWDDFFGGYPNEFGGTVRARVYGSDGTPFTAAFDVTTTDGAGGYQDVVALANGGFAIVWMDGGQILGQVFNNVGDRVGWEFKVNTGPVTGTDTIANEVSLAALPDGRFIVTWETAGEVRSQMMDPRDGVWNGTDAGETAYGHDQLADELFAFGGSDLVFGLGGDDFIDLGDGSDQGVGQRGHDVIYGGAGDDFITGGEDNDTLDGGFGNDTVNFSEATVPLTILMGVIGTAGGQMTGGGEVGSDRFFNFENILAGGGADFVRADDAANFIAALGGADTVFGGGGADTIEGGAGDDVLYGQFGADTLRGGDNNDQLFGWVGDDTLTGGAGADRFVHTGPGEGTDIVTDYSYAAGDLIDVAGDPGAFAFGQFGTDVLIFDPQGNVVFHLLQYNLSSGLAIV
jgi:Ca2+-binding RTX toxin-like protein